MNYLKSSSEGMAFVDTYKESMKPQSFFTSTPEQFKDSSWNPNITIGLEDNSLMFVPTTKIGQTLGNATKEVSSVIIRKADEIDNTVSSWISIKKDNLSLPANVKKWTTDQIGYDDINDALNASIPPSTFFGTTYNIYDNWDVIKEKIKRVFPNNQNNTESNNK